MAPISIALKMRSQPRATRLSMLCGAQWGALLPPPRMRPSKTPSPPTTSTLFTPWKPLERRSSHECCDGLAWALRYAAAGMLIFPVNAQQAAADAHGFKDASSDPEVIKAWRGKWAHCDFGWAMPRKHGRCRRRTKNGKDGFKDFKDRAGCDPHDVPTPQATTPSGGLHVIYEAAKA